MSETEANKNKITGDAPQALVGFMTNEEWDGLLDHVNTLIQEMEELQFPQVKEKIFELLAGVDAIHREALMRLVRLFKEGVMEAVVTDPAIHTLMELYDLLPPEAEKIANSPSKGKINHESGPIVHPEMSARPSKPKYPHWVPILKRADELKAGTIKECVVDDITILICHTKDKFFAVGSYCSQDRSSLAGAHLNKFTLTCPHHSGCYYDIRTGARIAGLGQLECFSIKTDAEGRILVGIDMEFDPQLPAF
jgi:nitrite reductase/ring-hydroxylating ferredoxin subunit